jgi:hypothetical protein
VREAVGLAVEVSANEDILWARDAHQALLGSVPAIECNEVAAYLNAVPQLSLDAGWRYS